MHLLVKMKDDLCKYESGVWIIMDSVRIVIGIFVIFAVIIAVVFFFGKKKPRKPRGRIITHQLFSNEFEDKKRKLKPFCSAEEFSEFVLFLHKYKGGFIKSREGDIVSREYLNKEKGDLKGIFYNIVFPNPNITTDNKEIFRNYLISIGVEGVEKRPDYESRDTKLRNTKQDAEEHKRKEVGNIGEKLVRDTLENLNTANGIGNSKSYSIINGPCYRFGETTKEFDHIVVGKNGIFIIETKAFGMTDGKAQRASLFIDPGDKWIIRKNKSNRELVSPTDQVMTEKEMIENMLKSVVSANVYAILVCCNSELFIKNNIELPYAVLRIDELLSYIVNSPGEISEERQKCALKMLDTFRIN